MSWLATLFADIAVALFERAGQDIVDYIQKKKAKEQQQAQNQAAANASVKPLQSAVTGDQVDSASDDALGGI